MGTLFSSHKYTFMVKALAKSALNYTKICCRSTMSSSSLHTSAGEAAGPLSSWKPRYFDIGVNFSDPMFNGFYGHSTTRKHPSDMDAVIARAKLFGVRKMLITASNLAESEDHFGLCAQHEGFYSTVGVHPCSVAQEFYVDNDVVSSVDEKLAKLKSLVETGVGKGVVKAFGEIGLDYDRLHYSTKEQQVTMFRKQLEVVAQLKHLKLPLFLHMRNACDDFIDILQPFIDDGSIIRGNGVVHSFTGSEEELKKILDLGFYVGINGCSLKTEENVRVASLVPKDKLMIETDAPWCEIRKSHASHKYLTSYPNTFYPKIDDFVPDPPTKKGSVKLDEILPFPSIKKENWEKHQKAVEALDVPENTQRVGLHSAPLIKSRNEPVMVGLVAEILTKIHGIETVTETQEFLDAVYNNTCNLLRV